MNTKTRDRSTDRLLASPTARAIDSEVKAERQRLAGEIDALDAACDQETATLRADETRAATALAEANAIATEMRDRHREAVAAKRRRGIWHGQQKGQLEAQLRAAAPESILDFIHEAQKMATDLSAQTNQTPAGHAIITHTVEVIRAVVVSAEGLKLQALSDDEIEARLEGLRDEVRKTYSGSSEVVA